LEFRDQFDKGLADTPDDVIAALGLALIGSFGPPAYPDTPGYEPDLSEAHAEAAKIANAMGELRRVVPEPASYVSESNFFEKDWRRSYWGANHRRLKTAKATYDPDGLFFVHHGVGSEDGATMDLRGVTALADRSTAGHISRSHRERLVSLRVFGCLPVTARGAARKLASEKPRRRKPRGSMRRRQCRSMGI
jgi:hypothetical protein